MNALIDTSTCRTYLRSIYSEIINSNEQRERENPFFVFLLIHCAKQSVTKGGAAYSKTGVKTKHIYPVIKALK